MLFVFIFVLDQFLRNFKFICFFFQCISQQQCHIPHKVTKRERKPRVTLSKVRELRQARHHWNPLPTARIYLFTLASVSGPDGRAEIGWGFARSVDFPFSVYKWMIVFAEYLYGVCVLHIS